MNLLSSVVITVGFSSIDATKYRFDTSLRKTITKQIVAKALNETHDTRNYLRKIKMRHFFSHSSARNRNSRSYRIHFKMV